MEKKVSTKKEEKSGSKKIEELTGTLQRLQADFENFRKRVDKERQLAIKDTIAAVIKEFLPVVDAFDVASKNTDGSKEFREGIELINKQIAQVFSKFDVTPIENLNCKFDPSRHEVLMQEFREDVEDGTITAELQRGYSIKDYVLRASKVKIARKKSDDQKGNAA